MLCPVCGSAPRASFRSRHGVLVWKCGSLSCGHLYADDPAPDQGVQDHPDPEAEHTEFRDRNRRLIEFWRKRGFIDDGSAILDVGAGSGQVVRSIREEMPETRIVCLEPEASARSYLRAQGFALVDSLAEIDRSFDAVLLIEVIEHVPDPIGLLAACKKHAGDRARLFLTTPCGETRWGSRETNAYETREHVQFFTEQSLRLACREAGFDHVEFVYPNVMYPPGRGRATLATVVKSLVRPIRIALGGHRHFVAFVA